MKTESVPWINRFLSLPSSYIFVPVPAQYLSDFAAHIEPNGHGIQDPRAAESAIFSTDNTNDTSAELLYGLAHANFLQTPEGRELMVHKQQEHAFQPCPRFLCRGTTCFPCGVSDIPGTETVKMYCPNCDTIYNTKDPNLSNVDGAFFGSDWLITVRNEHPELKLGDDSPEYVPTIFGFRIYQPPNAKASE